MVQLNMKVTWITPKLLSKEEAWDRFKLQFNEKSEKKIEQFTEEERKNWFIQYFVPAFTYKALNRLIQGSAADMTKKAMVLLYEKGIVLTYRYTMSFVYQSRTTKHGSGSRNNGDCNTFNG